MSTARTEEFRSSPRSGSQWPVGRGLLLILALNAAILAAYAWSLTEQTDITIVVRGSQISADLGDTPLVSGAGEHSQGAVGVLLESDQENVLPDWLQPVFWPDREATWTSIKVTSLRDGSVLLSDNLAPGLSWLAPGVPNVPVLPLGDSAWSDYRVDATLVRGRETAGLAVLVGADGSGDVLLFRPAHRDAALWSFTSIGRFGPFAEAGFRVFTLSTASMVQDLARLTLKAYPWSILLVALAALSGNAVTLARRRRPASAVSAFRRPRSSPLADRVALGVAIASAIALTVVAAVVAYTLLDRIPHVQDSVAYYFQAKTYALGKVWAPTPKLPQFFAEEFVVMRDGQWFGKYPPGWPLILAIGVLAGAPWLVNPILAGISLFLVYLIGRRLYGPSVGLVAGLLCLSSPFVIFMSGSWMAHPAGLALLLGFIWAFSMAFPEILPPVSGKRRQVTDLRAKATLPAILPPVAPGWGPVGYAFAAGAALGMATMVRPYSAALVALPFGVALLVVLVLKPRLTFARLLGLLAGLLPIVGAYLIYNAAMTGDVKVTTMELWWSFDTLGFGPDHGMFGHTIEDGLANTGRNMYELLRDLYGWPPYFTLAPALIPFVLWRARRSDWLLAVSFTCVVVGYAAWWADGIMYGPRFYYEGIGALFLLTARGILEAVDLARRNAVGSCIARSIPAIPIAVVMAGLLAFNLGAYLPEQWGLFKGYNFVSADSLNAVRDADIHNAVVFTRTGEWYEWWNYGKVFSANSPLLNTDVIYARDLGLAEDRLLMAEYPDRRFYVLAGTSLTEIRANSP